MGRIQLTTVKLQMDGTLSSEEPEFQLYQRRWLFLVLIALLQIIPGTSNVSFGQISDVFVTFYGVTYAQVDWLTLAVNIGPIILTIPLSWCVVNGRLGFRALSIAQGVSTTLGFAIIACSAASSFLFSLMLLGQIINSLATTARLIIPPVFSALWFPERQVGTAIGFSVMSSYLGNVLGYTLLPNIFQVPLKVNDSDTRTTNELWMAQTQLKLAAVFSAFSFVALFCTIILFVCVSDHPPTPPSQSQMVKEAKTKPVGNSAKRLYLDLIKCLLRNKTYLLCCIVFGILSQINMMELTMLPQMLTKDFQKRKNISRINVLSGYVMTTFAVACLCGSLAGGELINRNKQYQLIALVSCLFSSASFIGLILAYVIESPALWFACFALYGFMRQVGVVALYEMLTQVTYPIDEAFSTVWMAGFQSLMGIAYAEAGREIFSGFGCLPVLVFQSVNLLITVLFCCFLKVDNNRLNAVDVHQSSLATHNELTALLNGSE